MQASDLTDEQKDKIFSALKGTSIFQWSVVDEALSIQDSEDIFTDDAEEIMAVCDLEYCERCGWIFSALDGYGETEDDSIVCYDCGDKDE